MMIPNSKKGYPYDNAVIESYYASLKKKDVYLFPEKYQDFESSKLALFQSIDSFYNRNQIHSAIGYRAPQEMEDLVA